MMCAMAFTICYHLPGDAQHALDPCSVPNEMDNLCPALVCVAVAGCSVPLFVCFNYKSLFIAATATRVWRRHDARIIVFDAIFSSAFTIFFCCLRSRVCVFLCSLSARFAGVWLFCITVRRRRCRRRRRRLHFYFYSHPSATEHRFVSILFDCWMLFHPSPTRFPLPLSACSAIFSALVFFYYLAFV